MRCSFSIIIGNNNKLGTSASLYANEYGSQLHINRIILYATLQYAEDVTM